MSNIKELAESWLKWDKNAETRKEIQSLLESDNQSELKSRLEQRIAFGTAGLRGPMKAGFSCMNDLTVIQASQGLCIYVEQTLSNSKNSGIVVGYDGRHHSKEFARLTAATFASRGFKVYLFSKIVPTPYVVILYLISNYMDCYVHQAFAVPELKASVGVMITASHNPKDDNGYKVYWDNGCQINTPHDIRIAMQIDLNLEPWNIDVNELLNGSLVSDPLDTITKSYFGKIAKYSVKNEVKLATSEKIVYTAMHGVGGEYAKMAFETFGLPAFIPVDQQIQPDPEFPTVAFPNPEEGKGALKLSIETAERNNSRLILANDPDADRLAVAERQPDGQWKVFNGNEIGVLFADWAWQNARRADSTTPAERFCMINTAVSSSMLKTMANKDGYRHEECLTGFKWVGNKARELMDKGYNFLFAYEEAIGFMYGDVSLDKDGVRCAPIFAELALTCYQAGKSCQDHLEELYKRYGYHISKNRYFFCYDPKKMVAIFDKIRNYGQFPTNCGDFYITRVRDLTVGYDSGYPDHKARLPVSSSTQMITFYFENGGIATLRGSGTEPKLKYYVEMIGSDRQLVESTLSQLVEQVINQFLRPVENELTPPKDD
ncbi:phosphoglucomutase [Heterostelium album PN500]|uniref:Phosphoglucomutase n=1 Tax=Heterostelium pallidum (strain ATCC 26659 / Pp 5 / PN500) TaxID=670386 RepID=D3BFI2_HETP5|nr:phosphoglucomutase [Heterostelium album PN500]EFA79896.1 phosphoglucomutase [Heterostelium album PN500]|eukprot:XP_020432017.1 phosphoglucomutase [Heterostelium album PN500]